MDILRRPFIGSEAIEAGLVAKHELRSSRFTAVYPDVYLRSDVVPSLVHLARAAWLWSHREGLIAGLTASGLHGAKWIDGALPVELVWPNARPPRGIRTYDYRLPSDEFTEFDDMRVLTVERTAFDIGRRGCLGDAVARLDALGNATRFRTDAVACLATRHAGVRGLRQLRAALDLHDPGAQSPKETWLRLLLCEAGFPRPQTQIPVLGSDGYPLYYLDMGWEDMMIAVEYDGDDHRERPRFRRDIVRSEYIAYLGWTHIRVVAGDRRPEIVHRVNRAFDANLR